MSERLLILAAVIVCAALLSAAVKAATRRRKQIARIDESDLEDDTARVVVFTSPYCHGCRQWLTALGEDGVSATTIDIAKRPDAAARYSITSTPRIVVVGAEGAVLREFHHHEPRRSDLDQIQRLLASG